MLLGEVDTGLLARHRAALPSPATAATDRDLALAALFLLDPARRGGERVDAVRRSVVAVERRGWLAFRTATATTRWRFSIPPQTAPSPRSSPISAAQASRWNARAARWRRRARWAPDGTLVCTLAGARLSITALRQRQSVIVIDGAAMRRLDIVDPMVGAEDRGADSGRLQAPMLGKVTVVHAAVPAIRSSAAKR